MNFISSNVASVLGYEPDILTSDGKVWLNKVHPDDKGELISLYNDDLIEHPKKVDARAKHKDGHYLWLSHEINASTDENYQIASAADITEIKQKVIQFKESNHQSKVSLIEKETLLSEIYH